MAKNFAAAIVFMSGLGLGLFAGSRWANAQCDHSLTTYAPSDVYRGAVVNAMTMFDDGSGPALVVGGLDLLEVPPDLPGYTYNIAKWSPRTGLVALAEPEELFIVLDLQVFQNQLYSLTIDDLFRWSGSGTQWLPLSDGLVGYPEDIFTFDDGSGSGESLFVATGSYSPYQGRLFKLTNGEWREVAFSTTAFQRSNRSMACWSLLGGSQMSTEWR